MAESAPGSRSVADGLTVQIPDVIFWGGVTFVGSVVAWLVRLESRLNARLTRKEHAAICENSNARLSDTLAKIQTTLEKQNESSLLHRQLMGDSLATIRVQVAVIRTKMGDDPLQIDVEALRRIRELGV